MPTVLDFSKPHVLRDEAEYAAAMEEIEDLLDRGVEEGEDYERLEFLSVLVAAYEEEHEPELPSGTPQSIVEFMLEQQGKTRGDLADILGGRSRVSEFFNGKRELSKTQIGALRDELGIPADLLI